MVGVYMRESDAVNEKVRALMSKPGPFPERVVKAVFKSIDAVKEGRYLPAMLTPDGAMVASQAMIASKAFYEGSRKTMAPFLEEAKERGEVRADLELDDLIEWNLRIIFSFAMYDSAVTRSARGARRLVENFLLPALRP
jgi:hypothetical protein